MPTDTDRPATGGRAVGVRDERAVIVPRAVRALISHGDRVILARESRHGTSTGRRGVGRGLHGRGDASGCEMVAASGCE
jgi:hypothetical protein